MAVRVFVGVAVALVTLGLVVWNLKSGKPGTSKNNNVSIPTIIGGELVLPEVDLKLNKQSQLTGGDVLLEDQIWVMSANLVGIFKEQIASAPAQLASLRVLGEMYNPGKGPITNYLPIIRFLDGENNLLTQKLGRYSSNYELYLLEPNTKGVYDITVDDPPLSDKIEVVLKPQEGDRTLRPPVALKVASRSSEIQTTQGYDTYLVKGEIINTTAFPVADILVNAYVLDTENKVFGVARESFKSDLIRPGETIPFKILVLPVKTDSIYEETIVEVWGREYRL